MVPHVFKDAFESAFAFIKSRGTAVMAMVIVALMAAESASALFKIASQSKSRDAFRSAMPQMHLLFLLGVSFFVAASVWQRLTPMRFIVLVTCVLLANEWNVFEMVIHRQLLDFSAYPHLWMGYEKRDINPQWSKLLFAAPFAAYATAMSFRRSWRTLDRIFLTTIAVSVLATISLFHVVINRGMTNPAMDALKYRLDDGLTASSEIFKRHCKRLNADCFVVERQDDPPKEIISPSGTRRSFSSSESLWLDSVWQGLKDRGSGRFIGFTNDADGSISPPKLMMALRFDGETAYGVSLRGIPGEITRTSQLWFCFLAITAHTVWIVGGLFLLSIHKRRRRSHA